jgi:hypothetical protein
MKVVHRFLANALAGGVYQSVAVGPELGRRGTAPQGASGLVILALLLAILGNGCTLIPRAVESSSHGLRSLFSTGEPKAAFDPVILQEDLLRYSDNLTSTVVRTSMKLGKDGAPISRKDLLTTWVVVVSDVVKTATGANSLANLVEMIVLTTSARMRIEEYWLPKVYGESARPLLEGLSSCEEEIWLLAEPLMTPPERQELLDKIEQRLQEAQEQGTGPSIFGPSLIVRSSVVSEIAESHRKQAVATSKTSLLGLLDMDPLAGLDPTTRELAQTRLLAERAMFIAQRWPQIIQWQAELLTIRTAELPQVEQVVSNTTQLAAAMDRVGKLAEELPGLVSSEKPGLVNLSREIGSAFGEGARMAESTDTALKTFDSVAARFDKEQDEPVRNKEPFRIKDYADTAAEIGRTTERLTTLLSTLQPYLTPEALTQMSTAADTVAARTQARGQEVVDYAFRRGLQLVAAVLFAALAYRAISARIVRLG